MSEEEASDAVTALHDLSAVDMIAGFRARQFSPSEVLDELLAHVALWEPHIKALYAFDPDGARAAAKASTERWQNGEADRAARRRSRHHQGEYRDQRRRRTARHRHHQARPGRSGRAAGRALARSRRIIFSKTTMPDFGMLSSGLSSFHPLTRNPWDLRQNPGGSSAGAGAAAAAGYGPLASWHRYRRLGAAAGLLVRSRRTEAEPRTGADRSALCRPRCGTDDAHRR